MPSITTDRTSRRFRQSPSTYLRCASHKRTVYAFLLFASLVLLLRWSDSVPAPRPYPPLHMASSNAGWGHAPAHNYTLEVSAMKPCSRQLAQLRRLSQVSFFRTLTRQMILPSISCVICPRVSMLDLTVCIDCQQLRLGQHGAPCMGGFRREHRRQVIHSTFRLH
jgi:hypothetical protein